MDVCEHKYALEEDPLLEISWALLEYIWKSIILYK